MKRRFQREILGYTGKYLLLSVRVSPGFQTQNNTACKFLCPKQGCFLFCFFGTRPTNLTYLISMVLLMIRISFQEVYQGVISGAVLISDLFMMGGLCVNTFKFISWLHPNVCLKTNTPSPHACTHTLTHTAQGLF